MLSRAIGEDGDASWLKGLITGLTDEVSYIKPSEWAEQFRILPEESTVPGPYSFDLTPYWREPLDCFDVRDSTTDIAIEKAVQIGATTGVIENGLGYFLDKIPGIQIALMMANADQVKDRREKYLMPLFENSPLKHKIKAKDFSNARKTGIGTNSIQFAGGGMIYTIGSNSPAKLSSMPFQVGFADETDRMKKTIRGEGDPLDLLEGRTESYGDRAKRITVSTPTESPSKIHNKFLAGDQRYYHVPCLKCGLEQVIKFRGKDKKTGEIWGLFWEVDEDGLVIEETVKWHCRECGHGHINEDKYAMFSRGHWVATAKPKRRNSKSWHVSGMYSPAMFQSWVRIAEKWNECFDDKTGKVINFEKYRNFMNLVEGKPFTVIGKKLTSEEVSFHRRHFYHYGEIPNKIMERYAGGPAHVLICSVDVHHYSLFVKVVAWCPGQIPFVIEYKEFKAPDDKKANTADIRDPHTWGRLKRWILTKWWEADDGRKYKLALTGIDAGDPAEGRDEVVYRFCQGIGNFVIPVKGEGLGTKSGTKKEFRPYPTNIGTTGFLVNVDHYKSRWGDQLKVAWDEESPMDPWTYNAPVDVTKKQLDQLTAERRKEIRDRDGVVTGYIWDRGSRANEMWDCLMYNNMLLEKLFAEFKIIIKKSDPNATPTWNDFWKFLRTGAAGNKPLYFSEKSV